MGSERVVVRLQNDLTATLGVLHLDGAGELRDWRLTLRRTGFEQLGDTRKALRDIGCRGDATGVEGTKRQLRLKARRWTVPRRADRLADVDELVGGQRPAIALRAHAALGFAGEHGAADHLLHTMCHEVVEHVHREGVARVVQHGLAVGRVEHVLSEQTRVWAAVCRLDEHEIAVLVTLGNGHGQTVRGAAVLFAHDDLLGRRPRDDG